MSEYQDQQDNTNTMYESLKKAHEASVRDRTKLQVELDKEWNKLHESNERYKQKFMRVQNDESAKLLAMREQELIQAKE